MIEESREAIQFQRTQASKRTLSQLSYRARPKLSQHNSISSSNHIKPTFQNNQVTYFQAILKFVNKCNVWIQNFFATQPFKIHLNMKLILNHV